MISSMHADWFPYLWDQEQERSFSVRSYMWTIKERTRLRIKFQTNPGNAVFESTVEYTDKDHINILIPLHISIYE
jgi:hypothetical protein